MFKKTISYLAAFIAIATAFIFGRAVNRQRISRDNDSIDRIRDGIAESKEVRGKLETGIGTSEKLVEDIGRDNRTAVNRIRTAREILERAKKRADDNKNP